MDPLIVYESSHGHCLHYVSEGDCRIDCGEVIGVIYEDGSEGSADEARRLLENNEPIISNNT